MLTRPSRSSSCCVVCFALVAAGVWRVVSVVVPAKTKAKLVILYDLNNAETRRKLQQYVDLNELEEPYGRRKQMSIERYLATEPSMDALLQQGNTD